MEEKTKEEALEAEVALLRGKVAYLEGKVGKYERNLLSPIFAAGPLRAKDRRPHGVRTPEDNLPLHVHRGGKEPLVQVRDGLVEGVAPAGKDDGLEVVEDLDEPPGAGGAVAVEVQAQPEAALDAPGVQGGELLGGADGKESGEGHGPPRMVSIENLTDGVLREQVDFEQELFEEHSAMAKVLAKNDFRDMADLQWGWKREAVAAFVRRLIGRFRRRPSEKLGTSWKDPVDLY